MQRINARAGEPSPRKPLNWDGISALVVNMLFWAIIAVFVAVAVHSITRFGE